jgi:hypothetical protein
LGKDASGRGGAVDLPHAVVAQEAVGAAARGAAAPGTGTHVLHHGLAGGVEAGHVPLWKLQHAVAVAASSGEGGAGAEDWLPQGGNFFFLI